MRSPSPIKEDLLQYVWLTKKLDINGLVTVEGHPVEIIKWGYHNHQSGPDFLEGKIKIQNIEWIGNIEMHTFSSMWKAHHHHLDKNYENVILHVVYEHDMVIKRADGSVIPTIEIKNLIPKYIRNNYLKLIQNNNWVPCSEVRTAIPSVQMISWMETLMVERLERKIKEIQALLLSNDNDWEQVTWELLGRYLGTKANAQPMMMVTQTIDINSLYRMRDNLMTLEATLLGVGGFLNSSFKDNYPLQLKREFSLLKAKYKWKSIDPSIWKFGGIRPANFPTIRLIQLAQMIGHTGRLFRRFIDSNSPEEIISLFKVEASGYWDTHYKFDIQSPKRKKRIGKAMVNTIIINVIAPLIFAYGHSKKEPLLKDKALLLLTSIDPEKNRITKGWEKEGLNNNSALESQALIQLKTEYCDKIRCLSCRIGHSILTNN